MPESFEIANFAASDIAEDGERVISGIAVPFGTVSHQTMFGGRPQRHMFKHGAFNRTIRERGDKVKLMTQHDTSRLPIGKAVELVEERDGLRVRFEIAGTSDGNDALELVRSGYVNAFSVGVEGMKWHEKNGVIVHTESKIREISLVNEPAFPGTSAVAASASADGHVLTPEAAWLRLRLRERDFHG